MPEKAYIGDSVYAELEPGGIRLTTENGYGPSNEIILEPAVYQAAARDYESGSPALCPS